MGPRKVDSWLTTSTANRPSSTATLECVYPEDDEHHHDPEVDIICVPALGANPRKTWWRGTTGPNSSEKPNGDRSWLRTELVPMIPNARILLYDDRTFEIWKRRDDGLKQVALRLLQIIATNRSSNNALKRPLVFVGHSTGGLVLKKALLDSSTDTREEYKDITESCICVTFFAVPHQGSSVLSGLEFTEALKNMMHLQGTIPNALRMQLKINSTELDSMAERFSSLMSSVRIFSFYETEDSRLPVNTIDENDHIVPILVHLQVVSQRSAVLGLDDEWRIGIDCDHMETAMFGGLGSVYCNKYLHELRSIVSRSLKRPTKRKDSLEIREVVKVGVYQFYAASSSEPEDSSTRPTTLKIWCATPTLKDLLDLGPAKCIVKRLAKDRNTAIRYADLDTSFIPNVDQNPTVEPPLSDSQDPSASSPSRRSISPRRKFGRKESRQGSVNGDEEKGVTKRATLPADRLSETVASPGASNLPAVASQGSIRFTGIPEIRIEAPAAERTTTVPKSHEGVPIYLPPNPSQGKFRWVHIPYTHTGWVKSVLKSVAGDCEDKSCYLRLIDDQHWSMKHNHADDQSPHAYFVHPWCEFVNPDGDRRNGNSGSAPPRNEGGDPTINQVKGSCDSVRQPHNGYKCAREYGDTLANEVDKLGCRQLVLFLPFLHWDSYKSSQDRIRTIKERLSKNHLDPAEQDIHLDPHAERIEWKLIWEYLKLNPPIHCRRTLDQYGYPTLKNTTVRDRDQVLYKKTRNRKKPKNPEGQPPEATDSGPPRDDTTTLESINSFLDRKTMDNMSGNVLMVDQLWLWVLDNKTVVTFFPRKEPEAGKDDGGRHKDGDLLSSIYNDLKGDLATECNDAWDLSAVIVRHAVTILLERIAGENLKVFRLFEEYISFLTEHQASSWKRFRNRVHEEQVSEKIAYGTENDSQMPLEEIAEDLTGLLELRDIEDELAIISRVFEEQKEHIKTMSEQYVGEPSTLGGRGRGYLEGVWNTIRSYEKKIEAMNRSAGVARVAYNDLLDLKQKQTSIDEARAARREAELAGRQSRAVLVFTIFTVIFLPLSFFTSLFGMNIREWSGQSTNLSMAEAVKYMCSISFAVIFIALLFALSNSIRHGVYEVQLLAVECIIIILEKLAKTLGITSLIKSTNGYWKGGKPAWIQRVRKHRVDRKRKQIAALTTLVETRAMGKGDEDRGNVGGEGDQKETNRVARRSIASTEVSKPVGMNGSTNALGRNGAELDAYLKFV